MKKEKLTCEKARKIDIMNFLSENQIFPVRENENSAFFLSFFRCETKASLKVDKRRNQWFDHGAGYGGNIIDLVIRLKKVNVSEALNILSNNIKSFSFHQQQIFETTSESKISIKEVKPIQHSGLLDYLESRNISTLIAQSICHEVHFELNAKRYFSIGLKNKSDGFELRNRYFKSGSSPKDISIINNGHSSLFVTEGMFDMLSLLSWKKNLLNEADLLILNSCSFSEKLADYQDKYETINLFMDRDNTGKNITKKLVDKYSNFYDCSMLYDGYDDINDWWIEKNKN